MSVASSATVLLFVMDPFGNMPLVVSLLKDVDPVRRRRIIVRELLIALGVLALFLVAGEAILRFLGLQPESVTIAGGIVLGVIGLRMIFPRPDAGPAGTTPGGEPFIVPLAVPLIAGPSAMATVILMAKTNGVLHGAGAVAIAWVATAVVLLASPLLFKLLRKRGLEAVERLMGMLLIMIAAEMVLTGLGSVL